MYFKDNRKVGRDKTDEQRVSNVASVESRVSSKGRGPDSPPGWLRARGKVGNGASWL